MTIIVSTTAESTPMGGMTFVQLVRRLRRRCRVGGSGNTPVTITNQNEEISRLIDWINEAWRDIQEVREDWQWMRASASFPTVAGQSTYSAAQIGLTDFGNWTRDTWRNYDTSVGTNSEIYMEYLRYEDWRDTYQFGALRSVQTRPLVVSITPDKSIALGPFPNGSYTVTGDYFKAPTEMTADGDIPAMPERFHMLIVYRAMMFYGVSEAASEVYQEGQMEFEKMMRRLQLNQMPEIGAPSALA